MGTLSRAKGGELSEDTARVYPAAIDEPAPSAPARPNRKPIVLATALAVVALLVFALVKTAVVRALLPLALAAAAVMILARGRRRSPEKIKVRRPPDRALELTGEALSFKARGRERVRVLDPAEPFGLTLFSTHARDRVVALLSSKRSIFYVGAGMGCSDALGSLLDRATTIALDDPALDAVAPDGQSFLLAPHQLARLVHDLLAVAPDSFERLITTDAKGAAVVVDESELRVGPTTFDLDAPLEWKAIVFQEPLGAGVAVFQGTWVKQSGAEVVLVSSLTLGAPVIDPAVSGVSRSIERDLRLMQASVEDPPPPRDKRFAIDRTMMIPLRSALQRAPRRSIEPRSIEA